MRKKYPSFFGICLCNLASFATGMCTVCIVKYICVQMVSEEAALVLFKLILLFALEFLCICTMSLHWYKKARDMLARYTLIPLGAALVIWERQIAVAIIVLCSLIVFIATCIMNVIDREYAKRVF